MKTVIVIFLLLALGACGGSADTRAKRATMLIEECKGTVSVEYHLQLWGDSMVTRCQWEKKSKP